jgi:hypothetical protein
VVVRQHHADRLLLFLHRLTTLWHVNGVIIPYKDGNTNEADSHKQWNKIY